MNPRVLETIARLQKLVDEHHETKADSGIMHIDIPMPLLIHELKLAIYESALIQAQLIVALAEPPMLVNMAKEGDVPNLQPVPGSITYTKDPR